MSQDLTKKLRPKIFFLDHKQRFYHLKTQNPQNSWRCIGKLQNLLKPLLRTLESPEQICGHLQVWWLWTELRLTPETSAATRGRPLQPPVNGGTFLGPRLRTAISHSPPLPSPCSPLVELTVRPTPRPMSSSNMLPVWRKIILMIMEMGE